MKLGSEDLSTVALQGTGHPLSPGLAVVAVHAAVEKAAMPGSDSLPAGTGLGQGHLLQPRHEDR